MPQNCVEGYSQKYIKLATASELVTVTGNQRQGGLPIEFSFLDRFLEMNDWPGHRSKSFRESANPTRLKTLLCAGFRAFRFGAGIATFCTDEVARNGAQLRNFGQRSQKRPLHSLSKPSPALPRNLQICDPAHNFTLDNVS